MRTPAPLRAVAEGARLSTKDATHATCVKNLLGGALVGLLATPLVASEAAAAGGGGPFSGDVGTALWTLVIFALVVLVLGKYAWSPLLSGLQARERFIGEALESAGRDREAAEARLKEYEQKLAKARDEATAIVDEARRDAEVAQADPRGGRSRRGPADDRARQARGRHRYGHRGKARSTT